MLSSQHLAEGLDDGTLEIVPSDELSAPFHAHVTEETAALVDDFVHGKSPLGFESQITWYSYGIGHPSHPDTLANRLPPLLCHC